MGVTKSDTVGNLVFGCYCIAHSSDIEQHNLNDKRLWEK